MTRRPDLLRRINLAVWILVAVLVVGVVITLFYYEKIALHFFGPPAVEMEERYAGSGDGATTFDHGAWTALLAAHVDEEGRWDYPGLRADRRALAAYLDAVAAAPFAALSRDGKLALLLNLHNAATARLVIEHSPESSIREIPEADRWQAARWRVAGETLSLDQIENDWLRARFVEPRIHFALVTASLGGPPSRREAYVAERLEEQLQAQALRFHSLPRGLVIDPEKRRVSLSRIYQWFDGDFRQVEGDPRRYAARFDATLAGIMDGNETWSFGWLDYDWDLDARAD
ncbi:MAG: DUF547 domain-containing protein [Planctomycetota bacterium]